MRALLVIFHGRLSDGINTDNGWDDMIHMSFQHLADDDPTRACFGDHNMHKKEEARTRASLNGLFRLANDWCWPKQIVSVRRILNHTEIPEFEWYPENLGVSCNWRGLFTALLLEERLSNTKITAWVCFRFFKCAYFNTNLCNNPLTLW